MKAREINYVIALKLMLPALLVICALIYQFCIRGTVKEYQRYAALAAQDNGTAGLSISPAYSTTRNAAVKKLYQRFLVDTTAWTNELWNRCAILSQKLNCSIEAFPEPHFISVERDKIIIQEVTFNGRFHDLWKLQDSLVAYQGLGLVGGLTYSRDHRASHTTLKLQLFALSDRRDK